MGTQGEIFNVLGVIFSADEVKQGLLYSVHGKIVSTSEDFSPEDHVDFFDGFTGAEQPYDFKHPELRIKILNVNEFEKERKIKCFDGRALVGYALANESYAAHAKSVPMYEVNKLKPKLVQDITLKLGFAVKESDLGVFLLFEFSQ